MGGFTPSSLSGRTPNVRSWSCARELNRPAGLVHLHSRPRWLPSPPAQLTAEEKWLAYAGSGEIVMTKRLIAITAAWFVYAELVAVLQWLDVFGSDDQPWQTVFVGNILYVTTMFALPLMGGWLLYAWVLQSLAERWPRREPLAAIVLVPIAVMPGFALAAYADGISGAVFIAGYALVSVIVVAVMRTSTCESRPHQLLG
jgi:hypothetical protein